MPDFVSSVDVACSLFMLGAVALGAGYALIRREAEDSPISARVREMGGSFVLGRAPMQVGYSAIVPLKNACVRLGLSANAVTGISLALGTAAGVALAMGHFGVCAALAGTAAIGDAIDGLIARESGRASTGGAIFDAVTDRYTEFFFLGGLAICVRGDALELGAVLFAVLGSFMVSYASAKAEACGVKIPRGSMRRAERAVYLIAGAALVPLATTLLPAESAYARLALLPIIGAVALVAVVGNASAVLRFIAIGRGVEPRVESSRSAVREAPALDATLAPAAHVGHHAGQSTPYDSAAE
jgi:phosphatidylglycerophosphate synthase